MRFRATLTRGTAPSCAGRRFLLLHCRSLYSPLNGAESKLENEECGASYNAVSVESPVLPRCTVSFVAFPTSKPGQRSHSGGSIVLHLTDMSRAKSQEKLSVRPRVREIDVRGYEQILYVTRGRSCLDQGDITSGSATAGILRMRGGNTGKAAEVVIRYVGNKSVPEDIPAVSVAGERYRGRND